MAAPAEPTTVDRARDTGADYRYDTFTTRLLLDDMRFHRDALAPGDLVPVEEVDSAEGASIRLRDRTRPLLVVTGSMSCPMTATGMPSVARLYAEFGDEIDFALLSAREAHPGEQLPQPKDADEILERARAFQAHYAVPFPVLVDEPDGRLHRLLDAKPNAAFLFAPNGRLVHRSLWASDEDGVRAALGAVAHDEPPAKPESRAMMQPMARALGHVDEVLARAGPSARRDLWRSAPPMALMGRTAAAFRFAAPDRRGAIALGVITATIAVLVLLVLVGLVL